MLLTITTTHEPATDLSFLLHKHPDRFQTFDLNFGQVHVFYPVVSPSRTTAAILLDIDPVGMVRGKSRDQSFLLDQYVNDRPYVASSFLSVALAQVFSSAMSGRCKDREELAQTPLPISASLDVLPVRGGEGWVRRIFEPLGYTVDLVRHPLDTRFPDWGESPYYTVTISGTKRLSELLSHLYVLIPVFDGTKHYFVGDDEIEKLLSNGEGWLAGHPEKEQIVRRYLSHRSSLCVEALARLADDQDTSAIDEDESPDQEVRHESKVYLHQQRHSAVVAALRNSGAKSVLDLGCGEGKLVRELLLDRQFERIVGMDVSIRSLEIATRRLKLDRLPEHQAKRVSLIHGSLIYRDQRLANFDAAAVVEVIEHLDMPRLASLERVVFEFARPGTVVVTTPNREYNAMWETLPAGQFRHSDHRFEWTRSEFEEWSRRVADRFGYSVQFATIGSVNEQWGAPTQMGVFKRV